MKPYPSLLARIKIVNLATIASWFLGVTLLNAGTSVLADDLLAFGYTVRDGHRPLYKINPADGTIAQTITTVFQSPAYGTDVTSFGMTYGAGYLWAFGYTTRDEHRPLYKINPADGTIAQTITTVFQSPTYGTDVASFGLAYGAGYLWAFGYTTRDEHRPLYKINPADGTIAQTITTVFQSPTYGTDVASFGLTYGTGYLWAFGYTVRDGYRPLYKINPADGTIAQTITTVFQFPTYGTDVTNFGLTYEDLTLPTGSVIINSGNPWTSVSNAVLTIGASDLGSGIAAMRLRNNNLNWAAWETFSTSKPWTLSFGDGLKTVYVQFMDGAGNQSAVFSDSITLVSQVPDLMPTELLALGSVSSGTSMQVACNITNLGPVSAAGAWADGIYLSSDTTFISSNAMILAYVYGSHSVAARSTYAWTHSVDIPIIPPGLYYLYVVVNDSSSGYPATPEVTTANNTSQGSALQVSKASATVTLGNLLQVYNGKAHTVSATTSPPNLPVRLSYNGSLTAPTNTGTYTVVGLINHPLYQGGATNTLVICEPIVFHTSPTNQTARLGQTVTFRVNATGPPPLSYQWRKHDHTLHPPTIYLVDGGNVSGATTSTLTLSDVQLSDGGTYSVLVSSACQTLSSVEAMLTVIAFTNCYDYVVTSNTYAPQADWNQAVKQEFGPNAEVVDWNTLKSEFGASVDAIRALFDHLGILPYPEGDAPAVTWNGSQIWSGSRSYGVNRLEGFVPGGYLVHDHIQNYWACLGSWPADRRVIARVPAFAAPTITMQPQSQTKAAGSTCTFQVMADGTVPLSYQWLFNGNNLADAGRISGSRTDSLTITNVQVSDAGSYSVIVTTACGSVASAAAILQVDSVADLTLKGMGGVAFGQLGIGFFGYATPPVAIAADVVHVAAGYNHSMFVKTDGTLWALGDNTYGQLGDGTTSNRSAPVLIATNVIRAAASWNFSLFVKGDGTLWAMGGNASGQLGDGTSAQRKRPVQVAADVKEVAAGYYYSLFVKKDGTLWGMGANDSGQLGDGTATPQNLPVMIATEVMQVAAGQSHSLFVKTDGTLWAMGDNRFGQLGDGTQDQRNAPVHVSSMVQLAAAGAYFTLFVKNDGSLWATGYSDSRQLGLHSILLPHSVATDVKQIAAGYDHSFFVKHDGTLWAVGKNTFGQLGDGTRITRTTPVQVATEVERVSTSLSWHYSHALFVKSNGTLHVMGSNATGQIGDAATTNPTTPVTVTSGIENIAAGYHHSLLITRDGDLWAMGDNSYGQLGDGTMTDRNVPVPVANGVIAAAGGLAHTVFVKSDGTLWAVGGNGAGALGDGTTVDRSTPIHVASDVISVAASYAHSLFLRNDGTLWAMGYNGSGQLGDGTTINRTTPVLVANSVSTMAAGSGHSLYVKNDGTLWAMGNNGYGQLGDGTTISHSTPVMITSEVKDVAAAGFQQSLFLKNDGSVWITGDHNPIPRQVGTQAVCIAGGYYHSLFVKVDGTLWGMGNNSSGQLGDGTTISRGTPVQIATAVTQVAAGMYHSLFLERSGNVSPPVITTQPRDTTNNPGTTAAFTVIATGNAPLVYQWRFNGTNLSNGGNVSGATATNLTIANVQSSDAGDYTVVVTNSYGSVTSQVAVLKVLVPGQTFSLLDYYYPISTGNQWIYDTQDTDTYTTAIGITAVDAPITGYRGCSNPRPYTTNAVWLNYLQGDYAAGHFTRLESHWTNFMLIGNESWGFIGSDHGIAGTSSRFDPGLVISDQWRLGQTASVTNELYNHGICAGSATMSVRFVDFIDVTVPYGVFPECLHLWVTLTLPGYVSMDEMWMAKGFGTVKWIHTSTDTIIPEVNELRSASFVSPPRIVRPPQAWHGALGATATFSVEAIGDPTLNYQWRKNGINLVNSSHILGAATTNLTIVDVQPSDAGDYTVVVSNPYGSVTSAVASLSAVAPPSDDFSGPSADPAKWGPDIHFGAGGQLLQTNGVLQFLGDASILRPWIGSYGSYTQDWEIIADVNLANVALTQNDSHVQVFLVAANHNDTVIQDGWPGENLSIALDLYFEAPGPMERSFESYFRTNWVEVRNIRGQVNTASQNASLRISFAADTKTLTSWYDSDGAANGYSWTALQSVQITASGTKWAMDDHSSFRFALGMGCSDYTVEASDQAWADNFSVIGGVQLGAPLFSLSGNFRWARRVAQSALLTDELALGVAVDAATNIYVAGWFDGSNDFGGITLTSYGGQDAFLAKFNASGALEWVRQAGGTQVEPVDEEYWDHARGVGVDTDGNVYMTGGFRGQARFDGTILTSRKTQDFFLAKYSPAGNLLWVRQGYDSDDYAYGTGIAVDANGTSLAVGYFDGSSVTFDGVTANNPSGSHTAFIAKYDSAGTIQWARGLGGGRAYSTSVGMDAAGNCYVGGGFQGTLQIGTTNLISTGDKDGFLAKFNSNGVFQWARQVSGPGMDGGRLGVDAFGDCYYVGGSFSGILDFGGLTLTNTNSSAFYVAKYDTSGTLQWVRQAAGNGLLIMNEGGCAIDQSGNCFIPGVYTGSVDFEGTVITNRGGWDAFVAKYDTAGKFNWVQTAGGTLNDGAFRLALDSGGTPYVAGWFQWITAFRTNLLQAQGYQDVFLAKLEEPPQFCCVSASNGLFQFQLKCTPGERIAIDSSQDLTNWFLWQTHTLPTGGLPLSIPMGTNQHLFFRARIP